MTESETTSTRDSTRSSAARIERIGERLRLTLRGDTLECWCNIVADAAAQAPSAQGDDERSLAEAFNSSLAPESPISFEAVILERPSTGARARRLKDALRLLGCAAALAIGGMIVLRGIVAWWKDILG